MTAICVDDEANALQVIETLCRRLPQLDRVVGFTSSAEALAWMAQNPADLALLDVDMPGLSGLELARVIQDKYPDTAIIFLTGYPQFAVEAFALHVSGYLLKPVGRETLSQEVDHALAGKAPRVPPKIQVQTFGEFTFTVDGVPVSFGRAKAKELMAFLIERRGNGATRLQIFDALWENRPYDRSMQKQLDVVIRGVKAALLDQGVTELFAMENGGIWIRPEQVECDLYRFLDGDEATIRGYTGNYLSAYPWAEETAEQLELRKARLEGRDAELPRSHPPTNRP